MVAGWVAVIGALLPGILGYLGLCALDPKEKMKPQDRLLLSVPIFFLFPWLVYGFHVLAQGGVFARRGVFLASLGGLLLPCVVLSARRVSADLSFLCSKVRHVIREIPPLYSLCFSAILLGSLVLALLPVLFGMSLGGDTNKHLMYASQLLQGWSVSTFPPYIDFPWTLHYPFLLHAALAFLARLFPTDLFSAYFLLQLFQALYLPLGMYVLVLHWTSKRWVALGAMVFTVWYGGHQVPWYGDAWWFNPAIERILPNHLSRMCSLALFPFFLYGLLRILDGEEGFSYPLTAGLILGLGGAIHAYALAWGVLLVTVLLVLRRKDRRAFRAFLWILALGLMIGSLAYLPSAGGGRKLEALSSTLCASSFARSTSGQVLLNAGRFFRYYGIVGALGVMSILFWRTSRRPHVKKALIFCILIVLAGTYAKEGFQVVAGILLPYHPAQHKFGKVLYLAMVLLACDFMACLYISLDRGGALGNRKVLLGLCIVLGAFVVALGVRSTLNFAAVWSLRGAMGMTNRVFLRHENIVQIMKGMASARDVVAVPKRLSKIFASLTGLPVLFIDHPKGYSHCRYLANELLFIPDERVSELEGTHDIRYSELVAGILRRYEVRYLVVPSEMGGRFNKMTFLERAAAGTWKGGGLYKVFRVQDEILLGEGEGMGEGILGQALASPQIWRSVVGFIPLCKKGIVLPRVFGRRELEVSGLAFDGRAFWLEAGRGGRVLLRVDGTDGRVLDEGSAGKGGSTGLAWDGKGLWTIGPKSGEVRVVEPRSGDIRARIETGSQDLVGLAWGGRRLWTFDPQASSLLCIDPRSKSVEKYGKVSAHLLDVAHFQGRPWVLLEGGRVCRVGPEGIEPSLCLASPSEELVKIVWVDGRLWGWNRRIQALVQYDRCAGSSFRNPGETEDQNVRRGGPHE